VKLGEQLGRLRHGGVVEDGGDLDLVPGVLEPLDPGFGRVHVAVELVSADSEGCLDRPSIEHYPSPPVYVLFLAPGVASSSAIIAVMSTTCAPVSALRTAGPASPGVACPSRARPGSSCIRNGTSSSSCMPAR